MAEIGRPSVSIYALVDPRNGEVRYIGKSVNIKRRLSQHMRDSKRGSTPKDDWVKELQSCGVAPEMRVLVERSDDWERDERQLIADFRSSGCDLLNVSEGGAATFAPTGRPRGAYFKLMHRFQGFINQGATQFVAIRDAYRAQRKAALRVISSAEHDAWLQTVFKGNL